GVASEPKFEIVLGIRFGIADIGVVACIEIDVGLEPILRALASPNFACKLRQRSNRGNLLIEHNARFTSLDRTLAFAQQRFPCGMALWILLGQPLRGGIERLYWCFYGKSIIVFVRRRLDAEQREPLVCPAFPDEKPRGRRFWLEFECSGDVGTH